MKQIHLSLELELRHDICNIFFLNYLEDLQHYQVYDFCASLAIF